MTYTRRQGSIAKKPIDRSVSHKWDRPNRVEEFDLLAMVQADAHEPGRCSAGTYTFHCTNPQHHDGTPSLAVRHVEGRWKFRCHGCNGEGDAASYLVMTGRAADNDDGLRWLRENAGDYAPIPAAFPVTPPEAVKTGPIDAVPAPDAEKLMRRFQQQRGYSDWAVNEFGLTVVVTDRGEPRIRFPWFNSRGEVVFCQDRALSSDPRYRWLSPKDYRCPRPFGCERLATLDELDRTEFEHGTDVFLTEGLTDCVSLTDALHGYTHEGVSDTSGTVVLGLPGGQFKREWEDLFSGLDVFVITDTDEPGKAKREKIAGHLTKAASVTHVHVPNGHKDLSDWRASTGPDFPALFLEQLCAAMEAVSGG